MIVRCNGLDLFDLRGNYSQRARGRFEGVSSEGGRGGKSNFKFSYIRMVNMK